MSGRLVLSVIPNSESRLRQDMAVHYSAPKGFVGRNICFAVECNSVRYGSIVAGSATRYLPGRSEFLRKRTGKIPALSNIVNNTFFHVEKVNGNYPFRNFVPSVLAAFREEVCRRWREKYGDKVVAFESLVELPRAGECYRRDGWLHAGVTKGFTCKREGGTGTDSWSGRRVWDTKNLRPKAVFMRWAYDPALSELIHMLSRSLDELRKESYWATLERGL